jgi:3-hydroxyisobutyrate dehydrogenase
MLKDLRLAMEAAQSVDSYTPMGSHAEELYTRFAEKLGGAGKDFSGIIKMIDDSWTPPLADEKSLIFPTESGI